MKLARQSHAEIENFFREHLNEKYLRLPRMQIHCGQFAHVLTKGLRVGAITFGPHVFVAPRLVHYDQENRLKVPGWLIAHEATHVLQYKRAGMVGFFIDYLRGYWRALRENRRFNRAARMAAYLSIAEECDAREAETAFGVWQSQVARAEEVSNRFSDSALNSQATRQQSDQRNVTNS